MIGSADTPGAIPRFLEWQNDRYNNCMVAAGGGRYPLRAEAYYGPTVAVSDRRVELLTHQSRGDIRVFFVTKLPSLRPGGFGGISGKYNPDTA